MDELMQGITQADDKKAYEYARQVCAMSAASPAYYSRLEDFLPMLLDDSSFVRTRGFMLICAQARWDTEGRIARHWDRLSAMLHDPRPTALRQSLKALHEVALFRPELCGLIEQELDRIDLTGYRDSMSPLIARDIEELRKVLE